LSPPPPVGRVEELSRRVRSSRERAGETEAASGCDDSGSSLF